MVKAVAGMFSKTDARKAEQKATVQRAEDQQNRLAEQSRILNDRNSQLAAEAAGQRGGRRGRRQLAYKGQETGLRSKLGG